MTPELEAMRFEVLVRDLVVDDARRALRMARTKPSERVYVILFSARSGSTWLDSVLSATQRLGFPREYLNPALVRQTAAELDARTPEDLIAMLRRAKQSPNGVFGLKARAIDITLFGANLFAAAFAEPGIFFHLWRDNLVAQAVSLYRAVSSRRYHSNSPSTVTEPPPFDAAALLNWLRHVAATENDNVMLLQQHGIAARHLVYERITADRLGTVRQFAHALAVPFTQDDFREVGAKELTPVSDAWNQHAEARLRAQHATEITAIEAARLVKHGVPAPRPWRMPADTALQTSWQEGQARGRLGRTPRANPHPAADPRHAAWLTGWRNGWDDQSYLQPPEPGFVY
jgi:LPS sulfotransferase NodH/ribosome modulation factor